MTCTPCSFDREDYLFDDDFKPEIQTVLCEFNDDIDDLANELEWTRYMLAKLEKVRAQQQEENAMLRNEVERLARFAEENFEKAAEAIDWMEKQKAKWVQAEMMNNYIIDSARSAIATMQQVCLTVDRTKTINN